MGGGVNGIEANAVEITIDLNGFRIDGKSRVTAGNCIVGNQRNLTAQNGAIMRCKTGFMFNGGNIATDLRITEINTGISINGASAAIRNNRLIGNVNSIMCNESSVGCLIERDFIRGVGVGLGVLNGGPPLPALGDNNAGGNSIAIPGQYLALHPNACGTGVC